MTGNGRAPIRPRRSGNSTLELDVHASGFVTRVEGAWTDADLAQFRHFLALRQFRPTEEELLSSLQLAKRKYLEGPHRLFLCGDRPCCKARGFETSESTLAAASRMAKVPISITGCQGQCKHAPIASLRIGEQSQMFAQVANRDDWLAVLSFAKSAVQADSLLVNPGNAAAYLHDPFHAHPKPDAHSKALQFLLGRFRGEGHCGSGGYTFQKEVVGTFEAGGRFMALRMAATYPSTDGRKDTHRALVIVGSKPSSGNIAGRAYTDGGAICEYEVEQEGDALSFADAPPDHTREWKHSRKIIKPTNEGFDERLVVDGGGGPFTYYSISMRRIADL